MASDRNQPPSAQQIDFLPRHYHEEYERRRTTAWRILVVSLFLVALPTASLYQYRLRLSVERQLAQFNDYRENTRSDEHRLQEFSSKLGKQTAIAQLATFLQHPWPATQIVSAIVQPLPESISLEELVIRRERPPVRQSRTEGDAAPEKPAVMPAIEDRQALEQQVTGRLVVDLVGQTTDSRKLHAYLSQLEENPLIVKAEFGSMESVATKKSLPSIARFEAQLIVRPGYSLPGGPAIQQQVAGDEGQSSGAEDPS